MKSASERSLRVLASFQDPRSALAAMDKLYAVGTVKSVALDIYGKDTDQKFCDKLAVEIPTKPQLRRRIRDVCGELKTKVGLSFGSKQDFRENYLYLLLG